jgi:hypothetical protein
MGGARIAALCALALLAACGRSGGPAAPSSTAPAVSGAASSDSADAAAAKAFLDGLYAHYRTSQNNDFNPYDPKARVFDPDTLALLDADTKALKGDLGTLDGDLLCDCQDFVSLRSTVTVSSATPTTAKASAAFNDVGMTDQGVRHADFDLVKTPAGWRIHDIRDGTEPWLRQQLQDEIKSLKSGKAD